nr:unnamed protein product [Callosobruchus analis]
MSDDPGRKKAICRRGCKYPHLIYKAEHIYLVHLDRKWAKRSQGFSENLSAHLSLNVLKLCEENNIKLVCQPPNSHLTEPLAYFRPLKNKWRDVLWKKIVILPEDQFPQLLKTALEEIGLNVSNNLQPGFRKNGIYPPGMDKILSCLHKQDRPLDLELVGDAFLAHLEQKRREAVKP